MKLSRRHLALFLSLSALLAAGIHLLAQNPTYDLLIRGGRIIDGTGNPWFSGDVAIKDGRIAAIGHLANPTAKRVIDAKGLVVTPEFIDLHTHSDLTLLADGNAESKIRDGVTLDVIGESTSVVPRDGLPVEKSESVSQDWATFTEYFQRIEKQGISMNLISHVSAEQIRRVVLGYDGRAAKPAEIERMRSLVARSMKEGAWGLVTRFEGRGPDHPEGFDVTVNQYPYTAISKGWSTLFPVWVRAGGPAKFAERRKDPLIHEKIKGDPYFKTMMRENGWADIALASASNPVLKQYEGMRITEIASLRGDADPADTCINLMAEDGGRISGVFHNQSEDNIRTVLKQPWVAVASDGSAVSADAQGSPHPREFSTNARVLGHYVREEHLISLEDAVRKMTSFPAQIPGLTDCGQIRAGFAADVVVFDSEKIRETNSYEKPESYPVRIPYVLVNGTVVVDNSRHTGAHPGKVISGRAYQPAS